MCSPDLPTLTLALFLDFPDDVIPVLAFDQFRPYRTRFEVLIKKHFVENLDEFPFRREPEIPSGILRSRIGTIGTCQSGEVIPGKRLLQDGIRLLLIGIIVCGQLCLSFRAGLFTEFQKRSLLDRLLRLFDILHAGKLDDDEMIRPDA